MRIEFAVEGGVAYFPGLAEPVIVDVELLGEDEAEQLKRLIEAARFFDLPAVVGSAAPGAADYRQFILAIDDGSKKHTVRVLEPIGDPALQELVQAVQKHVKAIRAAKREVPPG